MNVHYFARNIHCVNIAGMVDQVLTEGRGTYHKVKSAVPSSIPKSIFLYSYTGAEIEWVMGACFLLVSKGSSGLHDLSPQGDGSRVWIAPQNSPAWPTADTGKCWAWAHRASCCSLQCNPEHGGLLAIAQNIRLAPEDKLKLFSDAVWGTIWWWAKVL